MDENNPTNGSDQPTNDQNQAPATQDPAQEDQKCATCGGPAAGDNCVACNNTQGACSCQAQQPAA